jgi:hypothetical protein
MSAARKLLILGGVALAALGMLFGLYYAVFVEHQTLDRMGASLAGAFVSAARGAESDSGIAAYAATKYNYVRQVDVHSHWTGLAMLLIVLGAAFDRVKFDDRMRVRIAAGLLAGSIIFPAGVLLQTYTHGAATASALAILGAALVTASLTLTLFGFLRTRA